MEYLLLLTDVFNDLLSLLILEYKNVEFGINNPMHTVQWV